MWAATVTVHVGEYHLGVRCDTDATVSLVRELLAAYVDDGVEAPNNWSVRFNSADPEAGPVAGTPRRMRGLNFLYESFTQVARAREPGRVVQALLGYLSSVQPVPDGYVATSALGLVHPASGVAALVPRNLLRWLDVLQPRLDRAGAYLVSESTSLLDASSGALVVGARPLTVDSAALASVPGGAEPLIPPGRYPVRSVAFLRNPEGEDPLRPPAAVALAAADLHHSAISANGDGGGVALQTALEVVAGVIARAERIESLWVSDKPVALAGPLAALVTA